MLPITIEVVSGPPLEQLSRHEGEEVQFEVANRGGQREFRVGKVVNTWLDGVVQVLFDGVLYQGTLFHGIHEGEIRSRGRLLFQHLSSRGS